MSQGNLKAIEKVYERWSVGDFRAGVEMLDPHVVLVHEPEFEVGDEPAYGIEAVLSYTRQMLQAWKQFTIEAEELITAGDTIFVTVRQRGVGAGSGAETELRYFMLWTFRGDKVVRFESIRDRDRALQAAGLGADAERVDEQNVEILRRAYEAYGRRDIEALQALTHDDSIIYTLAEGRAEPQPFRGMDGVRTWIENENDVWESVTIEDLEIRDLGDDRVFTSAVASVRGKSSGIDLSFPVWSICELRDGRIFRFRSYPDRTQALEAAGLSG